MLLAVFQAVENIAGGGANWGLLQMPFGDKSPQDVPWPNVPIQFSKQYYTMMQVLYWYLLVVKQGCATQCLQQNIQFLSDTALSRTTIESAALFCSMTCLCPACMQTMHDGF